ncbi:MAG: virulence protein, partial [Mageeibacillus sp.]|nr:virulence protein [Mageeibacillus sp.]
EPDEAKAYTEFIAAICQMSKEQKRVSATERPTDNEKFTFRVFLIRLGFIGDEYKVTRRILLRNLSGNSAWRNGAPKKEIEADN